MPLIVLTHFKSLLLVNCNIITKLGPLYLPDIIPDIFTKNPNSSRFIPDFNGDFFNSEPNF
ncbi:MAG TPA: hypothetical protein DCX41_05265 [Aequorivita sp.]|nr:hypothetical protein [Aequorivita sp.]